MFYVCLVSAMKKIGTVQMNFKLLLAQDHHLAQIVSIVNDEAKRSAATVAHTEEPLFRWTEAYKSSHHFAPWLVAVAEEDLSLVYGFAKASPYNVREGFNWSVCLSIYIAQEYQGNGIGSALYTKLFRLLRTQGFKNVYARIALPNPGSQTLHERFGLQQTGVLPKFAWKFDQWHDMGIYTGCLDLDDCELKPRPLKSVIEAWQSQVDESYDLD